ncbi:hypothetical protein HFO56_01840 [Rhizobium laguerreae]|uniref:hypothetical protein n=1 Tax=Rhizobium laguerreae TaxID=1076926 RepID=UPI001C9148A1|nr:hypothetical protein [Rhizobium laguerreae]MBY3151148.1 hypothetical protein [Rhizobium laguerreae]MBY3433346.1 hypothetical protein [Rhizobium laguerreae]
MKYGKYEIKKVAVNDRMSEETVNFSLDLYVDGKKFAAVSNDGRGGCHRTHAYPPFTRRDVDRVEEEMAQDEFLVDSDFERFDNAINTLLLLDDAARNIKRMIKTKAVWVDGNELYSSGYTNSRVPDEALFDRIRVQYPGVTILNTMTVEASAVESVKAARRKNEAELAADPLPGVPRI